MVNTHEQFTYPRVSFPAACTASTFSCVLTEKARSENHAATDSLLPVVQGSKLMTTEMCWTILKSDFSYCNIVHYFTSIQITLFNLEQLDGNVTALKVQGKEEDRVKLYFLKIFLSLPPKTDQQGSPHAALERSSYC